MSQFIPLSISPPWSPYVSSSMTLFLLGTSVHLYNLPRFHIKTEFYDPCFVFFFVLTSFALCDCLWVHPGLHTCHRFVPVYGQYSAVCMHHTFVRSPVDGHVGCSPVLATVNSAAVNTGLCVSFWPLFFSGCVFLGRKAMTNLDSLFKSRDIILPAKVHLVKATVVMFGCESWTVKKA